MKIETLYTYPIKSLRAQSLSSAELTSHGFKHDRRFMLLKPKSNDDGTTTYTNMHVATDPNGTLFFPTIHLPSSSQANDGKITVLFQPPKDSGKADSTLDIPLEPDIQDLEEIQVTMHKSPTTAYRMPASYNDWFSTHFGHPVILAYLGSNYRPVLMSTSPNTPPTTNTTTTSNSWLSTLTTAATSLLGSTPAKPQEITFADCAPYLVVSSTSMQSLHPRLPEGKEMDISKFRPNIVLSGAAEPWEEDYWAELLVHPSKSSNSTPDQLVKIACPHNCGRCASINIDYATGLPGKGEEGRMLALMQRDRRVDKGVKWSPVFGRYSFLSPESEGRTISVGDEVEVGKRNGEHTRFDWKGLATE